MKMKLSDVLSECTEEELGILLDGMSIDDHSVSAVKAAGKKVIRLKRMLMCAVILILTVAFVAGGVVYAAEKKEYNDAVDFLSENGFFYDELTRSEIKKVYRDIKSGSFSYEKTAELILDRVDEYVVEGLEIREGEIDPDKLRELWNDYLSSNYIEGDIKNNVKYSIFTDYVFHDYETGYSHPFTHSTVEKYVNGELIFSTEFEDFYAYSSSADAYTETQSGVIIEGRDTNYVNGTNANASVWVAFINNNGEYVWDIRFDDIVQDKYTWFDTALENDDGTFVLFVRMRKTVSVLHVSANGEIFDENTIDADGVAKALPYDDGYIVWVVEGEFVNTGYYIRQKLVFLDSERQFSHAYEYEDYNYTDIAYYKGKIYISATQFNPNGVYGYASETFVDKNGVSLAYGTDKKLLRLFKDSYTSYILVLDPGSGVPEKYYCVNGAFPGKFFFTPEGNLVWEVEKIVSVYYSPYTSMFTFSGEVLVYKYVFDGNGKIVNKYDTLELKGYRKR